MKKIITLTLFLFILVGCSFISSQNKSDNGLTKSDRIEEIINSYEQIDVLCKDFEVKSKAIIPCQYAKTALFIGFDNNDYEGFVKGSEQIIESCKQIKKLYLTSSQLEKMIGDSSYPSEYETGILQGKTGLFDGIDSINRTYHHCISGEDDTSNVDAALDKISIAKEPEPISSSENYLSEPFEWLKEESKKSTLKECDFSSKNIKIEDFILSREKLPDRFSKKNSWDEYEIPDFKITPMIVDDNNCNTFNPMKCGTLFEKGHSSGLKRYLDFSPIPDRLKYEVREYETEEQAKKVMEKIIKNSKSNHNTKKNTGNYGEERIEYVHLSSLYSISFRIDRYVVFRISYAGGGGVGDIVLVAQALHNQICDIS